MNKHTFKVGDRVIVGDATKGDYSVPRCGESGVLKGVYEFGYEVALDKPELNRYEGTWYVSYGDLRHDTDFQVGDWVRYVAVDISALREDGIIGKTIHIGVTDSITVDWGGGDIGNHNRKYLVKIQPPQKDSDDTIIHVFTSYTNKEQKNMSNVFNITHDKYGVVQGVHQVAPGCYCKNGAYYYHGEGWRETEEWVKIEVRKNEWATVVKSLGIITVNKEAHDGTIYLSTIGWRPVK